MYSENAPDKFRFIKTLKGKAADRVPNWEFVLMRRNTEALLGEKRLEEIEEQYRKCQTVWPPRSETEINDRSSLASYSCYLPVEDTIHILGKTGQDAAVCTLSWKPKSRKPESETTVARGQEGIIQDRSELYLMPDPPSIEQMMVPLDYYIKGLKNTGIGVGVLVRSVFCNTYETLGMENFMLKMYDDPAFITELFDIFHHYSVSVVHKAAAREVDFLALDDDLCDNNGFLVNPDFIKNQWLPRTKEIIEPFIRQNKPVLYHCCGNIKELLPMIIDMGISAVHPIQPNCNDIYEYKKEYGSDLCFVGNIDLAGVLSFGTPEQVKEETKYHIENLSSGGGYIVGSSHSITDDVPPENYQAMVETVWEYGRY